MTKQQKRRLLCSRLCVEFHMFSLFCRTLSQALKLLRKDLWLFIATYYLICLLWLKSTCFVMWHEIFSEKWATTLKRRRLVFLALHSTCFPWRQGFDKVNLKWKAEPLFSSWSPPVNFFSPEAWKLFKEHLWLEKRATCVLGSVLFCRAINQAAQKKISDLQCNCTI